MIDDLRKRSAAEVFETTCASLASIALRRTSSGTFRPTSLFSNVEAFSEAIKA
jgi:hypothetical protein